MSAIKPEIRYGLTLGSRLQSKRFGSILTQIRALRRLLECECITAHGGIDPQQALLIQTICRYEQKALLYQRQLAIGGGDCDKVVSDSLDKPGETVKIGARPPKKAINEAKKALLSLQQQVKLIDGITIASLRRDQLIDRLLGNRRRRATGEKNVSTPQIAGLYDRPLVPCGERSE